MNTYIQENIAKSVVEPKKDRLELIVVIMLGITALLTAWASWVGSQHAGNQSHNYNLGNIASADGNMQFNTGIQLMMTELLMFNDFNNMINDLVYAKKIGDKDEIAKLEWKTNQFIAGYDDAANICKNDGNIEGYEIYQEIIRILSQAAAEGKPADISEVEGYMDLYIESAVETWEEAGKYIEKGLSDSANSGKYGLVTVFYAMTLFMLGIISSLKRRSNKLIAFGIAIGTFLVATTFMLTLFYFAGFGI